jgi:hypothetical protein
MASFTGFYPDREGDQCEWLDNLGEKCAGYTLQLGSTAAEMTQVKAVCTLLSYDKGVWVDGLQTQAEAAVAFRNAIETGKPPTVPTVPPVVTFSAPAGSASPTTGLLTWLFTVIARWKTAPGCSESIMIDLGIKGSAPEPSTEPPDIKAKVDATKATSSKAASRAKPAGPTSAPPSPPPMKTNAPSKTPAPPNGANTAQNSGTAPRQSGRGARW